jgi:hypothetical protein
MKEILQTKVINSLITLEACEPCCLPSLPFFIVYEILVVCEYFVGLELA